MTQRKGKQGNDHCHGHACAHRRVKFCADCRKVYCGDCRQEWCEPDPYRFTYTPTTDQNLWPGLRQTWRRPFEVTCAADTFDSAPVTVASAFAPACH